MQTALQKDVIPEDQELLSTAEERELGKLESIIEKGLKTFYEVGSALKQIRGRRLYRKEYLTFENYCKERWGFERRYTYRLIDATEVNQNVSNWTQTPPTHEAQLRPLTHLFPDQQQEVWKKAVETAPDGKVTARHVEKTVLEYENQIYGVGEEELIEPEQGVSPGLPMARPEENIVDGKEVEEDDRPIEVDEIAETLNRGEDTSIMLKVMYYWESCTLQEKIVLFRRFEKDMGK